MIGTCPACFEETELDLWREFDEDDILVDEFWRCLSCFITLEIGEVDDCLET